MSSSNSKAAFALGVVLTVGAGLGGCGPKEATTSGSARVGSAGVGAGQAGTLGVAGSFAGAGNSAGVSGAVGVAGSTGTAGVEGDTAGVGGLPPPPPPAMGCPDKEMWTGTLAVHIVMPVTWPSNNYVMQGGGNVEQWQLVKQTYHKATDTADIVAKLCKMTLPPFHAGIMGLADKNIQLAFGDLANGTVPEVTLVGTPSADAKSYTTNIGALQLGVELTDPGNDPWPATLTDVPSMDHDGDGKPGLTLTSIGADKPAIDGTGLVTADTIDLATRTIFSIQGQVTSCDRLDGTITLEKEGISQHTLGCDGVMGGFSAFGGGGAAASCDAVQTQFTDDNSPHYKGTTGVLQAERVPDTSTCADVLGHQFM